MEDKYYWSAKENGFYLESMKELYEDSADGWPEDAAGISEELYQSLLAGQLNGKVITSDSDGHPVLANLSGWPISRHLRRWIYLV